MALKGTRVSDYGGKSLNSGEEHSLMFIDPEHKRTEQLKEWYENTQAKNKQFSSISYQPNTNNSSDKPQERPDNYKLIDEMI